VDVAHATPVRSPFAGPAGLALGRIDHAVGWAPAGAVAVAVAATPATRDSAISTFAAPRTAPPFPTSHAIGPICRNRGLQNGAIPRPSGASGSVRRSGAEGLVV